jgi:hypothetical protein
LDHGGAGHDMVAVGHVPHPQAHQVAAAQLGTASGAFEPTGGADIGPAEREG